MYGIGCDSGAHSIGNAAKNKIAAVAFLYGSGRDGKVSKYEMGGFPLAIENRFNPMDKNSDGFIVESEFISGGAKGGNKGANGGKK